MITIILGILITVILFCLMMMFRNDLVYNLRMTALCGMSMYDTLPSYNKMMWQLHKWTAKSWGIK